MKGLARTLFSLVFALVLLAAPLAVLADNVVNDVVAGGNDTFTVGGSTTVNYWIVATGGDGIKGCNVSSESQATVTIVVPANVTATPASLSFAKCAEGNEKNAQAVVFTATTAGDYEITVSVSGPGEYNTGPGQFTLHVLPAADATPPVITWVSDIEDGDAFYYGFVPGEPTCTAWDDVDGEVECTVTGYGTTVGEHTLTATASDSSGNTATETRTYTVLAWTLSGFYRPVEMNALNTAKGGSTVPLKFEVFAGETELTDVAVVQSFKAQVVTCDSGTPEDPVEITTTGGTSLRYDPVAGQFIQNWQTPKQAGKCYLVTMTTQDGSSIAANFKLK